MGGGQQLTGWFFAQHIALTIAAAHDKRRVGHAAAYLPDLQGWHKVLDVGPHKACQRHFVKPVLIEHRRGFRGQRHVRCK